MTWANFLSIRRLSSAEERAAEPTAEESATVAAILTSVRDAGARDERLASRDGRRWRIDLFLIFCSSWVAVQLWFWPEQFPLETGRVLLSAGVHGHEATWAFVCALAAVLKVGGLACACNARLLRLAGALMLAGLFMSIVIWTIMGLTWALDYPHSLAPIILMGAAFLAACQVALWKSPQILSLS
jgi:hypothetical protein